ncbi:hypothetical protein [Paraburkholderia terricola]|uniref:Type III secretion protein (HrpB7) n=1 Tax=Paraburkholderia terricola TaxID=169427 RepID=A0A1M6VI55_9BURK|nr:hypothetical protein [Paraburkholderia terricola]SDP05822.1 type III secretion protein (HrpB7) [Paraburkholderia sediminicola]SHK81158.1 type III secretion protein (HrpB7) [Paraburkholderia terricola]
MRALVIRKWRTIVAAKVRRCERIEADLARERAALAEREAQFDEAAQAHVEARQKRAEHEARIVALLDGEARVATSDYLCHDAWRAPLKEALEAARAAEHKRRTALDRQRQKVAEVQAALARAQAAVDECRRKLDTLVRAAATAAELAADEDAAENLLARRYAR